MRRLVVEYRVCSQLFSSTNFFNVFNAFPLSNDSRAMATHSSIGLAGSMACMAKEALISTVCLGFGGFVLQYVMEDFRRFFGSVPTIKFFLSGEREA